MNPSSAECFKTPYTFYKQLHSFDGPAYWEDYSMWCLYSFEQVNKALKNPAFARLPSNAKQPTYPAHLSQFSAVERFSLLALEAPEHTRLRRSLNRSFVVREVNKLAPIMLEQANNCIDAIRLNQRAELLQDYATPIPVRVITHMLGVPFEESQQLLDWSHKMVKVYTLQQSHEEEVEANSASQAFALRLQALIDEKRRRPSSDLLSSWIHEHRLTDDEMISLAVLLLNAGHEATVHQLGNAIKLLIENPEHAQTLLESDQQADAVVAEILRYDPPLHLFTRYAQHDIDLGQGVVIKQDEQVALLLACANRDPATFQDTNTFKPGRRDAATLALGAGTHFCVGAYLAKLELRIALQVLFKNLPGLSFRSQPQYKNSYHFHGLDKLEVIW
jgi:unspecific monooxygenase